MRSRVTQRHWLGGGGSVTACDPPGGAARRPSCDELMWAICFMLELSLHIARTLGELSGATTCTTKDCCSGPNCPSLRHCSKGRADVGSGMASSTSSRYAGGPMFAQIQGSIPLAAELCFDLLLINLSSDWSSPGNVSSGSSVDTLAALFRRAPPGGRHPKAGACDEAGTVAGEVRGAARSKSAARPAHQRPDVVLSRQRSPRSPSQGPKPCCDGLAQPPSGRTCEAAWVASKRASQAPAPSA